MPKQEIKKEDTGQYWDRLVVPMVLAFFVILFLMAVTIIYASGIELQSSDFLMMGIVLLICSCLLLVIPVFFRKVIFKLRMRAYYAFITVWVLMFISSAILILSVMVPSRSAAAERMACEFNLHKLWTLFQFYEHNNGRYPPPQTWADSLVQELSVPDELFVCISARPARSHYAMNPYCKADSPGDVVLLFETRGGWDQYGGPELMDFKHHTNNVSNVLLNDGSVLYIQPATMRLLNWGDKDGEQKAEDGKQKTGGGEQKNDELRIED